MKKTIKVAFMHFWPNFNVYDNFLINPIKDVFNVQLVTPAEADYVFFSVHGNEHAFLSDEKIKIFYTLENLCPDFNMCDYAIGFEYLTYGDRYLRLPGYIPKEYEKDVKMAESKHLLPETFSIAIDKPDFCSYTISNSDRATDIFNKLHDLLAEYKRVDSGGKWRNNVGGPVADKLVFDSTHKFSIVFENSSHPGYVTEKIIQAFAARTIPIYWGDPTIVEQFNKNAFINVMDYDRVSDVVDLVKSIDQNDELYLSYLKQPIYAEKASSSKEYNLQLRDFLTMIFEQPKQSCQRRNRCFWGRIVVERTQNSIMFERKQNSIRYMTAAYLGLLGKRIKKKIKIRY